MLCKMEMLFYLDLMCKIKKNDKILQNSLTIIEYEYKIYMYERCIIFLNRVNTIVSKILSKEKGD